MRRNVLVFAIAALSSATVASCSSSPAVPDLGPSSFFVVIDAINGNPSLPTPENPLPANHGVAVDDWAFHIEARTPTGDLVTDFNGFVRLTLAPGTVVAVTSTTNVAQGRNIQIQNGKASGDLQVTGVYGPTRLWVEDLGYVPAPAGQTPACSNGLDDNNNGLIDYPADPGCYYADDDTEDGGTYTAGVSVAVQYALPTIPDVRGQARTPYPNEAIEIATAAPENLVVTRVSSSGFFVTDIGIKTGYNSLFAYNFSTPPNMRVCDKITYLAGTANDFYGFTQLSFPSFSNTYVVLGVDGGTYDAGAGVPGCQVPEPMVLDPSFFTGDKNLTAQQLYKYEAGLVRVEGFTIAKNFGPTLAINNVFGPGQSNCDFNGDGQIDFTEMPPNCPQGQCEGTCSNTCDASPDCTEWTAYSARGEYKVAHAGSAATMIKINTSTVATFDPPSNAGQTLPHVTGTLTEFSGGTLNWTIEVRCPDDLVCPASMGCTTQQTIPSAQACVTPRTIDDNDEGTN